MSDKKVSIIIPLYNQERFFNACMRSVCGQSYKNLEIIIVNDGSTDKSPSISKKWAEKDHRIIIINKKNEGVTWARRDGLNVATGDYLAFVDSDDLIPKESIELLVRAMNDHNVDLAFGGIVRKLAFVNQNQNKFFSFPYNTVIEQPQLKEEYYLGFARNSVFPVPMYARLYRKTVVEQAMKETELFSSEISNMGEDQLFNFLLFPYLKSMYRIADVVYYYRYGGMTTKSNPYITQFLKYSDVRLQQYDKCQYEKAYRSLFIEYINMLYGCASHFLKYKVKDKAGVIDFFQSEYDHRLILPRAIEYFKHEPAPNQQAADFIINKDFDAMFSLSEQMMKSSTNSISYRAKLMLDKLIKALPLGY